MRLKLHLALLAIVFGVVVAAPGSSATSTPEWDIRAPLPIDLFGGAAASDGAYAYVAGGFSGSKGVSLDTLFRFNPESDSWTTLAPMPTAATMASGVYYPPTNKIYVFGGVDEVTETVYAITRIYDIASDTWSTGADMPDVRSFMASGYNALNGKIYLIAGYRSG